MADPEVSVVIPTWNRRAMVCEAVASVLCQDFSDLECIVVDDGSDDGTADALASIEDSRLRVLVREHAGIPAAKNAGMGEARGRVLAFLDSDDLWLPGKLTRQMAVLDRDPLLGLVYGRYRVERDGAVVRSRPENGPEGLVFGRLLRHIFIQTSTVVVPRHVAETLGGYDETLAYADEYDFFLRVARQWPVAFVGEDLVRYRIHEGNASHDRTRQVKENLRVYARFATDPTLPRWARRVAQRRAARYELLRGRMLLEAGDASEARNCFSRALRYRPAYPAAWMAWFRSGGPLS